MKALARLGGVALLTLVLPGCTAYYRSNIKRHATGCLRSLLQDEETFRSKHGRYTGNLDDLINDQYGGNSQTIWEALGLCLDLSTLRITVAPGGKSVTIAAKSKSYKPHDLSVTGP